MTISELFAEQKKQDAKKNLVGTLKFGAVAMPLMLIFSAPFWFKAHSQIPLYHQECRSAQTFGSSQPAAVPCYYEAATGQLKSHHSGRTGNIDGQDVLLNYPDGQTAEMEVSRNSGSDWTHSQVDGSCWAEVWHGKITAVLRPAARILAIRNPELDGGIPAMIGDVLAPSKLTLVFWIYLFILWQRGDLNKDSKSYENRY